MTSAMYMSQSTELRSVHTCVSMVSDFKIMCRHQSISIPLPRMTDCKYRCTCRDQTTSFLSFSLVRDIFDCTGSNKPIFFFSLLYARILVSQFYSPVSFPTYICTTQPGFESSLENTFSWFFDLFLIVGMTLHILRNSEVLGHMTTLTSVV